MDFVARLSGVGEFVFVKQLLLPEVTINIFNSIILTRQLNYYILQIIQWNAQHYTEWVPYQDDFQYAQIS